MGAIWFRASIWLRRQRRAVLVTGVVVGLVGGMALGLVAGTRRTASAPDRYTRQAGGDPDLQITQTAGEPLFDEVARIPGVAEAKGFAFVLAFPLAPDDGHPLTELNPFAGSDDSVGARVVEGRFTDPDVADEFTINKTVADQWKERYGTKVGDRFSFIGFSRDQLRSDLDLESQEPKAKPFTATLVGITESPSDFDEASQQFILSKAFFRDHADVAVIQTLIPARLRAGTDPAAVLDAVHQLPNGADAYPTPLRIVSDSARRAVRFQAVALWLVSALALVAAIVITALVAGRALRVADDERTTITALGWTRRHLATERAVEGAVVGIVAAPIAALVAYLGTPLFPLGELDKIEPTPGLRADWAVLALGGLGLVALTALVGAVVGRRTRLPRVRRAAAAPLRGGPVVVGLGVHFATVNRRGRRTWGGIMLGAIGVAGIVGAAVAGTSLGAIVDHHDRWGIDFDQLYGNPYAPADRDIVTPVLAFDHVSAATGATTGSVTIDGHDIEAFAYAPARGHLVPTVLRGRVAAGDREIALGAEVARLLRRDVGDRVDVNGSGGDTVSMTVVGIVVTPHAAGNGVAMTYDAFAALNPGATKNVVLVDFDDDAPSSIRAAVSDAVYSPPGNLEAPNSIRALSRVTTAPFLLCAVFGVILLVGGAYLLAASVRGRSRDFATLRAMGSERGQRRAVVRWQATAAAVAMTVVGVPAGILAGKRVVDAIVVQLGIVPGITLPWWLLTAAIVAPVVIANVVALVPAQRAGRQIDPALLGTA